MRAFAPLLCASLLLARVSGALAEPPPERVARGMKLLQMQGCTGCHSLDGSISAGPTFAGRFGSPVSVLKDGALRQVVFDREYLRRSLLQPEAEVAAGFAPGVMPTFALTDEQFDAIAAALEQLASAPPAVPRKNLGVLWIWLGALALVGIGVAALRLRKSKRANETRPK
jgi:mono/diheme cytochrome c family protein